MRERHIDQEDTNARTVRYTVPGLNRQLVPVGAFAASRQVQPAACLTPRMCHPRGGACRAFSPWQPEQDAGAAGSGCPTRCRRPAASGSRSRPGTARRSNASRRSRRRGCRRRARCRRPWTASAPTGSASASPASEGPLIQPPGAGPHRPRRAPVILNQGSYRTPHEWARIRDDTRRLTTRRGSPPGRGQNSRDENNANRGQFR
jgi:hypothetical protein